MNALVVDDDPAWREIVSEILEECDYEVVAVGGLEASQLALKESSFKLAVLDLGLGGNDHTNREGLRVLDGVRRSNPDCVAILLTGYASVELAVDVITRYGARSCLRKETFSRSEFRALVQEPTQAPPARECRSTVPTQVQGKALLVEDDAGWRELLQELLEQIGLEVQACRGYAEALGFLKRESYRLAIVDLSLSSSVLEKNDDGLKLLQETQKAAVRTIVVSGTMRPEALNAAYSKLNLFGAMEKQGFERGAFRELVDQALTPHHLANLTARELELLECIAEGLTNPQIAERHHISVNTVKRHLKSIFEKLGVHTRAAAAALAANSLG